MPRARIFAVAVALVASGAGTAFGQWRDVPAKGPLTPDGAPNLLAPAPKRADGKTPDLSGIWDAEKRACNEATAALGCIDVPLGVPVGSGNIFGTERDALPMQPWAANLVRQRRENGARDDPMARCLPMSPPRAWANTFLLKIVQTDESIVILEEYRLQFRQIFLDGRPMPRDPEPMFKGYSVARWEGDTLVVETTGFKDDGWLDIWGHPLTDRARTTERIRRSNAGTLLVEITVDDPKAYTSPWTVLRRLSLAPDTELLEYVCNENEKSLPHMVGADAGK